MFPNAAVLMKGCADRPVIGLRAARGKDELIGLAGKDVREGGTAGVDQIFGVAAELVLRGGVAEIPGKDVEHSLRDLIRDRGSGGIVQIVHKASPGSRLSEGGMCIIIWNTILYPRLKRKGAEE